MNPPTLYNSPDDFAHDFGLNLLASSEAPNRKSTTMSVYVLQKELAAKFNIGTSESLSIEDWQNNSVLFLEQLFDRALKFQKKLNDAEAKEAHLKDENKRLTRQLQDAVNTAEKNKTQYKDCESRLKDVRQDMEQLQGVSKQKLRELENAFLKREKEINARIQGSLQAHGKSGFKVLDKPVRALGTTSTDFADKQNIAIGQQLEAFRCQLNTLWSTVLSFFEKIKVAYKLRKTFITKSFPKFDWGFDTLEAIDKLCQIDLAETDTFRADDFEILRKIFTDYLYFTDNFDILLFPEFKTFLQKPEKERGEGTNDALKDLFGSETMGKLRDCGEATLIARNFEAIAKLQQQFLKTTFEISEQRLLESTDRFSEEKTEESARPQVLRVARDRADEISKFLAQQRKRLAAIKGDREDIENQINTYVDDLHAYPNFQGTSKSKK